MPSTGDARWQHWTRPLLTFIRRKLVAGRSWPELNLWRRDNRLRKDMVRHLLAWLESSGEIVFDYAAKCWKGTRPHV